LKTVAENWDQFKRQTIPKNAPELQIEEMKKAFYSGAFSIMHMQRDLAEKYADDDDACIKFITTWHQECADFFKTVIVNIVNSERADKKNRMN
jgi:hypothetical protein